MAAFGFSVGDFLAAIDLVVDLTQALSDTHGAKTKYQDLMSQLYALERALLAVKGLESGVVGYDAIKQGVGACQECIASFLRSVDKYQPLSSGTTSFRDQVKKVKWAMCHDDDVRNFKESLHTRTESLILLINATHLTHSIDSTGRTEKLLTEQAKILSNIQGHDSESDRNRQEISQKLEKLITATEQHSLATVSAKVKTSFNIRPLRLAGAPLTPAFVERPELMQKIEHTLLPIDTDQQTVLVLHGLGGIGKSQLAREYATRHQEEYSAIFWINAQSVSSLRLGMKSIARRLGLTVESDETAAVLEWLDMDENNKWLLILDNVDSQPNDQDDRSHRAFGSSGHLFDILPFLPSTTQGTLLLTSRLSSLARQVGGSSLIVDRMTMEEGIMVISKFSGEPTEAENTRLLVERLGAYPLALSQAGRYMSETQTSCDLFLKLYETRIKTLIAQKPSKREYQHGSIKATLELSFDALKDRDPRAAALLLIFGCFSNIDIFRELLCLDDYMIGRGYMKLARPRFNNGQNSSMDLLRALCTDHSLYNEVIHSLIAFSFVNRDMSLGSVSIHPVVHEWISSLSEEVPSDRLIITAAQFLANRHGQIWGQSMLDTHDGRHLLSRMRPHIDRCILLANQNQCLKDIAAGDIIMIGTYYMYQLELTTASSLIDLGLSLIDDGEVPTKVWFYMHILRMYFESWQPSEDRIKFICRVQAFIDSLNDDVSKFDSRDIVEEQLFGGLFISYMDEKLYTKALQHSYDRLEKVRKQRESEYSVHAAQVCYAWALIETSSLTEAIEVCKACEKTLKVWADSLDKARDPTNIFEHPEYVSKDLCWVMGIAYTAKGQQKLGQQYLSRSLIAYAGMRDNNMNDLIRLADEYNKNQASTPSSATNIGRWDAALKHVSEQIHHPPGLSQLIRHDCCSARKPRADLHRIIAAVRTATRTREGTDFYKHLVEMDALLETQIKEQHVQPQADKLAGHD